MTEAQLMEKIIAIGHEAEAFMKSNLGKVILRRAQDEIELAVESLKTVDAKDTRSIEKLQNEIWRAESLLVWLAEIIQEGRNAEEEQTPEGDD